MGKVTATIAICTFYNGYKLGRRIICCIRGLKNHTEGAVSLGRGLITSGSNKQKLNTKSSTEAELVGASDYLLTAIWSKMFIESQGYKVDVNEFYQDNQSPMKFEKNNKNMQ